MEAVDIYVEEIEIGGKFLGLTSTELALAIEFLVLALATNGGYRLLAGATGLTGGGCATTGASLGNGLLRSKLSGAYSTLASFAVL